MNYISFASTLASLILSVLAIFMTVLSGESMNKLRDCMIGLGDVPSKVDEALKSTIDGMQQSTNKLNVATVESNENIKKLDEFIDNKIKEIENHILNKLDSHQKTTLKAINDTFLDKKENPSTDNHKLSDSIVQNFLAGTSNASISLLYMIDLYCKKAKNIDGNPPIANLHDVATAINGGKKMNVLVCICSLVWFCCLLLAYWTTKQ